MTTLEGLAARYHSELRARRLLAATRALALGRLEGTRRSERFEDWTAAAMAEWECINAYLFESGE